MKVAVVLVGGLFFLPEMKSEGLVAAECTEVIPEGIAIMQVHELKREGQPIAGIVIAVKERPALITCGPNPFKNTQIDLMIYGPNADLSDVSKKYIIYPKPTP